MLSDLIPVLENLGLKVVDEYPYPIRLQQKNIWIYDFTLLYKPDLQLDPRPFKSQFSEAFKHIWYGHADNDLYNQLILKANLDWRQVVVLRSYARYMKQIRFGLSQHYIAQTLIKNTHITRQILQLFALRFDPSKSLQVSEFEQVQVEIETNLDDVSNLNEDRILRKYMELINATLRTNFYQTDQHSSFKDYISFKFRPALIEDMPKPVPMFEIFVYSPAVEGVHLRGGKVARGAFVGRIELKTLEQKY